MLSAIDKLELETALNAIRALIENSAASKISFEWQEGGHPHLTYTSTVPLEYVSVSFVVQDKVENE